jgi:PhoPQ-activated pathogenicity-related protein
MLMTGFVMMSIRTHLRPRLGWHRAAATLALLLWAAMPTRAPASGELADYVTRPDASYQWTVARTGRYGSGDYLELILTSQTWRDIPWKHQLFVFRPKQVDSASRQAFLYIDGGRWNPEYETSERPLPRQAAIFARLADSLHAPVAVLRQVPFQPLFERREDALIAYTFDRYLETGATDWPLLLPMVKSAVRAMDTVQKVAQEHWQLSIERFTVAGASKRGWTSWLTTATDPRVMGVAPMVIDMLNLPEQIRLQRETFGTLSEEVQDYDNIDLPDRIDTDRGRQLLDMVDPYRYRTALAQPKLILLATNDRYWPLDALSLYWPALPEPKRVLYVPNQGHGIRDVNRLVGALSALHRYSARGEPLPSLSWDFTSADKRLELAVQAGRKPARVTQWTATSPTRDFREAHWSQQDCKRRADGFACTVPARPSQYAALYSEVSFQDRGEHDFSLSTAVCIVDAAGAMVRECLDNAGTSSQARGP